MTAILHPGAALLGGFARWITGAEIQWRWRPVDARPRVYFANHTSHLDALLVLSALPEPVRLLTRPVACQEYWLATKARRYVAGRVFGSVLIPRSSDSPFGGRAVISALLRELERGYSLILFPEGTRGGGETIAEFRAGLYQLCRERDGLEAAPVYLENVNRVLPKGRLLPARSQSRVLFGLPLRLAAGESRVDFLSRARGALQELRSW
jgi:1-acyl-sn-glycerol-3-phosphate acyltransferase